MGPPSCVNVCAWVNGNVVVKRFGPRRKLKRAIAVSPGTINVLFHSKHLDFTVSLTRVNVFVSVNQRSRKLLFQNSTND